MRGFLIFVTVKNLQGLQILRTPIENFLETYTLLNRDLQNQVVHIELELITKLGYRNRCLRVKGNVGGKELGIYLGSQQLNTCNITHLVEGQNIIMTQFLDGCEIQMSFLNNELAQRAGTEAPIIRIEAEIAEKIENPHAPILYGHSLEWYDIDEFEDPPVWRSGSMSVPVSESSSLREECVSFTKGGIDKTPQQGSEKLSVKNLGELFTCSLEIKSYANPLSTHKNSKSFEKKKVESL